MMVDHCERQEMETEVMSENKANAMNASFGLFYSGSGDKMCCADSAMLIDFLKYSNDLGEHCSCRRREHCTCVHTLKLHSALRHVQLASECLPLWNKHKDRELYESEASCVGCLAPGCCLTSDELLQGFSWTEAETIKCFLSGCFDRDVFSSPDKPTQEGYNQFTVRNPKQY
ncbi:hypothetical protein INR49_012742, partial [Caranx melampygus]